MAREFIITSKYGGLGDLLFLSHLPRIAKQFGGFEKVLVSVHSEARHNSYVDLVWKMNPFVDGLTDLRAPYPEFESVPTGMNLLDKMMLEFELDDGQRYHEPEIYYKPKHLIEYSDASVYDPNFVSGVGNVSTSEVQRQIASEGPLDYQLKPRERSFPVWCGAKLIETSSLLNYCDIIFSCAKFYCLTSGGATLAAALKKSVTAFYGNGQKSMFHHSRLHSYINTTAASGAEDFDASRKSSHQTEAPDISNEVSAFFKELSSAIDPNEVNVVLDLGSRDAKVAIAFREIFVNARVFAFECNPEAIALCKRNLKSQERIELVEFAVSDVTGPLDFYSIDPEKTITPHADGNIGASSLFVASPDYPMEKYVQRRISVKAITLSRWLSTQTFDTIDVIWMDLQGAELKALKGLGQKLKKVRAIYAEVAFQRTYIDQPLVEEFERFLTQNGFERKCVLYADAWMGNILYIRSAINVVDISSSPSLIGEHSGSTTSSPKRIKVAVHCAWKPAAQLTYPDFGIELEYNPKDWNGFDFALDLDAPFSDAVTHYPPSKRIYAATEPSRFSDYSGDLPIRLANHYKKLILSWHRALTPFPHCRPWHALEKWASPVDPFQPKVFGLGGLISEKNVAGLDGYALRMKVLASQDEFVIPSKIYNFTKSWRGERVPYPLKLKDDAMNFMFHLSIENCAERGYFTEKILDAFVSRSVPLYYGDPDIGSVFDTRGIIVLEPNSIVAQINALTPENYTSRLPFVEENFQRSRQYWNLDAQLAKVLYTHLLADPSNVMECENNSVLKTPVVAGSVSPTESLVEVRSGSEFSHALEELFRSLPPQRIIETGTFLGTGTTRVIAETLRNLNLRQTNFKTIECNPFNARHAQSNLEQAGLSAYVKVLHGLSVPRSMLPTKAKIEEDFTRRKFDEQIYVDHNEKDRAKLYLQETEFPDVPDDLLGHTLSEFENKPDFVLLDSAGHIGNLEFNYLIDRLQGPCLVALDDVYHVKHHESLKQIKSDPRFRILKLSREKFGFCIASFTPHPLPVGSSLRNVVWIRSDAIGDNVLAASMLTHVRTLYSSARITVICDSRNTNLYEACPLIDEVIDFDRNKLQSDPGEQQRLFQQLGAIEADLCLNSIFSPEPLTDFLVSACRAKDNVGFAGSCDNMIPDMMIQHNRLHNHLLPAFPLQATELQRHSQFLAGLGIHAENLKPEVWLTNEDDEFAASIFQKHNVEPSKTIAFFAGAQSEKKRYSQYGKALAAICQEHGYSVLALGAKNDYALNQCNLDDLDCPTVNLSGQTTLRQGAAILKRCRMAVGADTGLAHIACAVNLPLVVILGGGHFGRFFPYSSRTSLVCLPLECYGCGWQCKYSEPYCITGVAVSLLKEAIKQTLENDSARPRIFVSSKRDWQASSTLPKWTWPKPNATADIADIIELPHDEASPARDVKPEQVSAQVQTSNVLISVCIITNAGLEKQKSRRNYLKRLLTSIDSAGFPDATEVILCGAVGENFKNHTVIERPDLAISGEVSALRNACLKRARGKWVIHCDDDILFTPGYWQSVSQSLTDRVDILCTRLLNPNGTRYWDWAAYYPGKGQTLLPYDVVDSGVYATGGHAIYRRSIFERISWNESIRHGGNEEFDLAAQAQRAGVQFGLCTKATVFLQYHHCDAMAVITQRPQAADVPCREFVALRGLAPISSPASVESLHRRIRHKIVDAPPLKPTLRQSASHISILVCCHRFLQRFRVFAQALCCQDYDMKKVELVVANPHSPDGLSEYLKMLANVCSIEKDGCRSGPNIKEVLVDQVNFRNRGLLIQSAFEASSGQVVIGMDADVIMPRNFLTEMDRALRRSPNHVIGVYRNFLSESTTHRILAGLLNPSTQFQQLSTEDHEEPKGYRGILGYCQAVKREHWARVSYPTEFDNIAESDVAFVDRLKAIGVTPASLESVKLLHLNHPRNWQGTDSFL